MVLPAFFFNFNVFFGSPFPLSIGCLSYDTCASSSTPEFALLSCLGRKGPKLKPPRHTSAMPPSPDPGKIPGVGCQDQDQGPVLPGQALGSGLGLG